jgi:hypothetical protein
LFIFLIVAFIVLDKVISSMLPSFYISIVFLFVYFTLFFLVKLKNEFVQLNIEYCTST